MQFHFSIFAIRLENSAIIRPTWGSISDIVSKSGLLFEKGTASFFFLDFLLFMMATSSTDVIFLGTPMNLVMLWHFISFWGAAFIFRGLMTDPLLELLDSLSESMTMTSSLLREEDAFS